MRTDGKPTFLACSTNQEMESRFEDLLMTVKNDLNAKMGDMKTKMGNMKARMDEKDDIIGDLKVRMGDMKTKMGDMKTRMDEKDGEIEGLNEKVDGLQEQTVTLRRELKTEKNGRQDDMNALREVRRPILISTFCCAQT
jgi:chromosome segregation ATPase